MNARNPSDPPRDENDPAGARPVPAGWDNSAASELEIVWSSPVSTGTGFRLPRTASVSQPETAGPAVADWETRHILAFESDLFDNSFVHWDQERPTLEMIGGFKKDPPPADAFRAESIASGPANLPSAAEQLITRVGHDSDIHLPEIKPFQPDMSNGAVGPAKVREDGIEDPKTGWRPTGLVFFETLSTPPRGTVYSSSVLDAFLNPAGVNMRGDHEAPHPAHPPSGTTPDKPAVPFFDFPDHVAAAPPEETEDIPLMERVITGGGSGGGGTRALRLFVRLLVLGLALVGLGLFAILGAYGWYTKQRLYDGTRGGNSVVVSIAPGESFRSVIDNMHQEGLLKGFAGLDDRYLMRYLAYFYEDSDKVKPGVYRFASGQNLNDVYRKIIEGSKDYKITIPEGKTSLEVAELVAKQYTNFDADHFMQLVVDPDFIKSVKVDAPSLEGYLYPSTYYFGPGMKEEELIKLMVSTFHKKMEGISNQINATSSTLSLQDHIIMASLIEREARMDEDRPLIASVIFNRLRQGIPLQIDATVNYALNNWRRLTNADYATQHPYNTYKFKGLPPGPITSPRVESILATYQAPETNYLYYVHKGDGHHAFAETYPQHLANVGRYIREKNVSGMGNAPSAGEMQREADLADESAEVETDAPAPGAAEKSKKPSLSGAPGKTVVPAVNTSASNEPIDIRIEPAAPTATPEATSPEKVDEPPASTPKPTAPEKRSDESTDDSAAPENPDSAQEDPAPKSY